MSKHSLYSIALKLTLVFLIILGTVIFYFYFLFFNFCIWLLLFVFQFLYLQDWIAKAGGIERRWVIYMTWINKHQWLRPCDKQIMHWPGRHEKNSWQHLFSFIVEKDSFQFYHAIFPFLGKIDSQEWQSFRTEAVDMYFNDLKQNHPLHRDRFSEQQWLFQGKSSNSRLQTMRNR